MHTRSSNLHALNHEIQASDGYLSGVPILVKDSIEVKGMPTCVGLKQRMGKIALQDAPVISRLRCVMRV